MRTGYMMNKKRLNITIDIDVVARARRYSNRHGTSISQLVGEFLAQLPDDDEDPAATLTATVQRLFGVARDKSNGDGPGPSRDDYRRYLLDKYGS